MDDRVVRFDHWGRWPGGGTAFLAMVAAVIGAGITLQDLGAAVVVPVVCAGVLALLLGWATLLDRTACFTAEEVAIGGRRRRTRFPAGELRGVEVVHAGHEATGYETTHVTLDVAGASRRLDGSFDAGLRDGLEALYAGRTPVQERWAPLLEGSPASG